MTGLRSSSATCGRSSASREMRSSVSRSAPRSAAGWPRWPSSSGRGADGVDQVVGVGVGQRREPGGVVTEHLGGDPAEPEHHQWPEHRLLHHPDDDLGAAGDHGLDENPGQLVAEPAVQPPHGPAHVGRPAQVEFHRAGVALVHQPGDVGLERHVAAKRGGSREHRVGAAGDAACPPRDPVAAQQLVGVGRGQPAATGHPRQEGARPAPGPRSGRMSAISGHGARAGRDRQAP